jgi:ABC-2 type transport system ATP-binding protein
MIRAQAISKRYDRTVALDQLSLEIPEGSVFGLLGPNGAGKTTFLRVAMGLVFADSGRIDLAGLHPARLGYLPEQAFYPPRFSIGNYMRTLGQLAGLEGAGLRQEVSQLLEQVGLAGVAGQKLGGCSRGMLQRLGLAQALLADPPLLLLDEPALGLDPAGQRFMREQIVAFQEKGKTVVLSSHHLDEVTRVCSHVAVLSRGRLVRSGSLEALLDAEPEVRIRTSTLPAEVQQRLAALDGDISVAERRVVLAGEAAGRKAEVLHLLLDAEVDVRRLVERQTTLEQVYLEATGQ